MSTMKKYVVLLGLLVGLCAVAQAQRPDMSNPKIEAAKIAFITDKLALTPEQAQLFWPLYNEMQDKRESITKAMREARQGVDFNNITEEKALELIALKRETDKKMLALNNEYIEKYRGVLMASQVVRITYAEEEFRRMLLRRLRERRGDGTPGGRRRGNRGQDFE